MNETRVNAMLITIQNQRDAALRDVVLLSAENAELKEKLSALEQAMEEKCTPDQSEEKTS